VIDAIVRWGIVALLAGAAIAAVIGAWQHFIAEPYRVQGDVRTATKLQPTIDDLTSKLKLARAANKSFGEQVAALKQAVTRWQDEAARQQARAAKAIADAQADNAVWADIVAAQDRVIHRPKSNEPCEGICARARNNLLGLAADSVRGQPAAP